MFISGISLPTTFYKVNVASPAIPRASTFPGFLPWCHSNGVQCTPGATLECVLLSLLAVCKNWGILSDTSHPLVSSLHHQDMQHLTWLPVVVAAGRSWCCSPGTLYSTWHHAPQRASAHDDEDHPAAAHTPPFLFSTDLEPLTIGS